MKLSTTTKILWIFLLGPALVCILAALSGCSSPTAPGIEPEVLAGQLIPLGLHHQWTYAPARKPFTKLVPGTFDVRVAHHTTSNPARRWWYHSNSDIYYYAATPEGIIMASGYAEYAPTDLPQGFTELLLLPRNPQDGQTITIELPGSRVSYRWIDNGAIEGPFPAQKTWKLSKNEGSEWWIFAPGIGVLSYSESPQDSTRYLAGFRP